MLQQFLILRSYECVCDSVLFFRFFRWAPGEFLTPGLEAILSDFPAVVKFCDCPGKYEFFLAIIVDSCYFRWTDAISFILVVRAVTARTVFFIMLVRIRSSALIPHPGGCNFFFDPIRFVCRREKERPSMFDRRKSRRGGFRIVDIEWNRTRIFRSLSFNCSRLSSPYLSYPFSNLLMIVIIKKTNVN